ncbi:MAG: PPOX class F420-dependent oxidoreductase [Rhodospirillales bacterium]|nr:PPOX class F420-dependent oxidoreductase [Rhodospirillales bacterium]
MTDAERDAFLRETRIGTLCTLNEDGSPNALPLWFEWDGATARMFSSRDAGKVRRLRRDPRASLTVAAPVGTPEAWVTVEGTVAILDEGGKELGLKLAHVYYEGERREEAIAEWSQRDDWVLLELTPTRIRSY